MPAPKSSLTPPLESAIACTLCNMCASEVAIVDVIARNDFLVTWAICVACDESLEPILRIDAAFIVCNMICYSSTKVLNRLLALDALKVLVAVFDDETLMAVPDQMDELAGRAISALDFILNEHPPAIVEFVKAGGEKALRKFVSGSAKGTRNGDDANMMLQEYMSHVSAAFLFG